MSPLQIQTCLQRIRPSKICICTAFAQQACAEIPVLPNTNAHKRWLRGGHGPGVKQLRPNKSCAGHALPLLVSAGSTWG